MKFRTIYASQIARLDSSVHTGGGTDDTQAIQRALDIARDEGGVRLVMDGAALVSHLTLYSNTTVECLNADCGFYQIAHTDDSLLTNANWNHYEIETRNVSLLGGTYNQNCLNQAHDNQHVFDPFGETPESRPFNLCLEFYGVENLLVRDVTIREFRTFAFTVGCFSRVTVENVWLDMKHHMMGNQDGFHFWGPGRYLTVRNCGGCVSDDIMNIGPDERDKVSSITDVLVDGLFLDDAEQAVRLLTRGTGRLDRVTIRNITGQYRSFGFYINPWFPENTHGNFGNILIENVDLKEHPHTYDYRPPVLFSVGGNIECLTLKNIRHHAGVDSRTLFEFGIPFVTNEISEDSPAHLQRIQTVILDDIAITDKDGEPGGREYIQLFDRVDTLALRNVLILKDRTEPDGTLVGFKALGEIGTLIFENVYAKGLKTLFSDETRVKSRLNPIILKNQEETKP